MMNQPNSNATNSIAENEYIKEAYPTMQPTIKPPWNPSVFYALAILCGFGAAGILAGINYGRLGKPELRWPTIGISVLVFVAFIVGLDYAEVEWPWVVNIPLAILLDRLQRSDYKKWKEQYPSARGGGWGIPVGVGVSSIALVFLVVIILGMARTPWTVHEAGPITPIDVGQKVTGTIDSWYDVEAFSFEAVNGKHYMITTNTPLIDEALDSMLTLWYADGSTILAYNDDYGGSSDSCIDWTAEATGIFYITVESADKFSSGDYTLQIECISR